MNVELLNTGSELMLGRVLNTHQQWLCRKLADEGWVVTRQTAVADSATAIRDAAADALRRAELVITTGGLGPTSDDLTREMVADLLGRRLVEDADARSNIEGYFSARQRPMPVRVLVQALVPEGAQVLPNRNGTAPGLAIEVPTARFGPHSSWLIMLPGPPRELRPMFEDHVLPLLRSRIPNSSPFHCVTLRTCGLGESWVEERVAPILPPLEARGLEIGYCARTGEVDVRLVTRSNSGAALIQEAEEAIRSRLGDHVFGMGEESLESVVVRIAAERHASLAVAESCTGGTVMNRLTNVPGASRVLWGGWVCYDNTAKEVELGVSADILREQGAVSERCAAAMADRALARSGATHALAVTGIAGPGGGTPDKPVGTAYIGLASAGVATVVRHHLNPFDRETFKYVTSQQALEMLRRRLLATDPRGSRP